MYTKYFKIKKQRTAPIKRPKNKYVASLFGVVNEVPITALKEYAASSASILVYPHEFEISKKNFFIFSVFSISYAKYLVLKGLNFFIHQSARAKFIQIRWLVGATFSCRNFEICSILRQWIRYLILRHRFKFATLHSGFNLATLKSLQL